MSWTAAVLIITSAFLHAFWNLISKRRSPTISFFLIAAISATIIASPMLFLHWQVLPLVPLSVWGLIAATGIAQTVYFSGLAGAYRHGDMSLAYPLARALPVLAVAVISLWLGSSGDIGQLGLFGMLLITIGCLILPLPHFRHLKLGDYMNTVYLMAAVAAVGTTAYTLIDDAVLRQLRSIPDISLSNTQITLLFMALQTLTTSLLLGIVAWTSASERKRLVEVTSSRKLLITGMLTGVVIMAAYGLVLASMAYVRNVSYVIAFRQLSIPIGAVLGLTLQNEARYKPKIVGIAIIFIGLILVGVG